MSEFKTEIKKHFYNPSLWITIFVAVVALVTAYNTIDSNSMKLETVERRLEKKIEVINIALERISAIEMELNSNRSNVGHIEDLKNEAHNLRIEVEKLKKDLYYLHKN